MNAKLIEACARAFSYPANGLEDTLSVLREFAQDNVTYVISSETNEVSEVEKSLRPKVASCEIDDVLSVSDCFPDDTAEKLAYTRLFIGSLEMLAPPYASYYTTDNHTLNGRIAAEVAEVYRMFGVQVEDAENAPADHLRYMLAFLSLLAERYEQTGDEAFAQAYGDFRDSYIRPWYGQFSELVDKHADAPYYPALVKLIDNVIGS